MTKMIILTAGLVLSGCAMSTAGLGKRDVAVSFEGSKPAEEVAGCVATQLNGPNSLAKVGDGHWVVTRPNGYGAPVVRWDIYSTPAGNRVELRTAFGVNSGEPKVRACAGA